MSFKTENEGHKASTRLMSACFLFLTCTALTYCSKNNDASDASQGKYYVRFKANGVQQEYRSDTRVGASASDVATHPYGNTINTYYFGMSGYGDRSLAYPSIQFKIESTKVLKIDSLYKSLPASIANGYVYLDYASKVETFEKTIGYSTTRNAQVRFTEAVKARLG